MHLIRKPMLSSQALAPDSHVNPLFSKHDQSFVTNDEDGEWIDLTDWTES